jgi:hypothetical protein
VTHPCHLCAGACCETLVFPLHTISGPDVARWLGMRGEIRNRQLRVEVACCNLSAEGTCDIYDARPQPCRDLKVGSSTCLEAVSSRRSETADVIFASIEAWNSPASTPSCGSAEDSGPS